MLHMVSVRPEAHSAVWMASRVRGLPATTVMKNERGLSHTSSSKVLSEPKPQESCSHIGIRTFNITGLELPTKWSQAQVETWERKLSSYKTSRNNILYVWVQLTNPCTAHMILMRAEKEVRWLCYRVIKSAGPRSRWTKHFNLKSGAVQPSHRRGNYRVTNQRSGGTFYLDLHTRLWNQNSNCSVALGNLNRRWSSHLLCYASLDPVDNGDSASFSVNPVHSNPVQLHCIKRSSWTFLLLTKQALKCLPLNSLEFAPVKTALMSSRRRRLKNDKSSLGTVQNKNRFEMRDFRGVQRWSR